MIGAAQRRNWNTAPALGEEVRNGRELFSRKIVRGEAGERVAERVGFEPVGPGFAEAVI